MSPLRWAQLHRCALRLLVLVAGLFGSACAHTPETDLEVQATLVEQARDPELLVRKARSFAAVGDFARAEQYATLAIDHGAREEETLPLLLEVCVLDQRYRDAARYVQDYLRRHPSDHRLRFVLASLYAALGQVEDAREALERALSREPSNADGHYALAVLLRDGSADYRRADMHFRAYLRLKPDGPHAEEASESLLRSVP